MDWIARDKAAIMGTYGRLPLVIDRGEGNYLIDENGKSYLDLITGLAVNVIGHSHPEVVKALQEQGQKFLHISNLYVNKPAVELAEQLSEATLGGKVFFANSGAEATEAAVKLIHKWSIAQQKTAKRGIVVLKNSFHGRTLGALKLTRQKGVYQDFPKHDLPVYEVERENVDELQAVIKKNKPAALLMEPVLGSGGVIPLSHSFLQEAQALCKQENVLFCMDEIQTGMGRTGKLFAYMHADLSPDVVLFAKGVGGGLPLGGIIVKQDWSGLFAPGDHGTTFAPSPLSCALGLAVLRVLQQQGILADSQQTAAYLHDTLTKLQQEFPSILEALRGKGMMIGLPTKLTAENTKKLQQMMMEQGVLIDVTQQTIVRLLPPLTLTKAEVDTFAGHFRNALVQIDGVVAT
ncbi:aspartate aminotransferase family protein [Shouchella clausii]|uniref:aspartate aminotransferase family protein n=1 Tax=Shouchella clausii TaxID=79880 RepID=UPI000B96D354|nr:acetylornithine transaminase [Shouchella clausii]AST97346.1 aspartate aminotransferase family protein [Shouchella clausii]MCR1287907.1 acetylornithine transaminase [Shouchella clausii]MEB5473253.1 acetylornithine transaminase [Shouchella clausii]QNM43785.1 aminotransferase class III-fold pyridoxal phosphate-dependent enzyme [Shouchella clausii]WQG93429.1 acetylornithine transaminase [Shouchella clausii]